MKRLTGTLLLALLGCGSSEADQSIQIDNGQAQFESPVITNAETPVAYPPELFESGVQGTVLLRLYLDSLGTVVPDSTRVEESSGFDLLDSAALAGVSRMRFAPARQNGVPVATAFLQPVHFRHPDSTTAGG